ncbi:prephenate dehydratase [Clostridium gasigenes]|uniref:prephenate dehydratase n=1 Tax=Clostridium gasigenes TaxID=94869 RepID=UPI001C0BFBFD|nr:prephenate dehydratase [Clostridium gasigenes]MBU3103228.1 prephenate dehydratase [Clostridium gasigenes]
MKDLNQCRKEIDKIDKELVVLFEKRMDIAINVAEYKKENNLPILNSTREKEVIDKNIEKLNNKEYANSARKFFAGIMEVSRSIQGKFISEHDEAKIENIDIDKSKKLGFQGVRGSFSEEALLKYFGENTDVTPYEEFEDVFEALKNNNIDYGILPIENSCTGSIRDVYDLLSKYGFYIVAEECIKINQHLIGIEGATIDSIEEVYSHPQGFEQSNEFLKNYHNWKLIPYHNTATSAKMVHDLNDKTKSAIASERAAKIYGLNIIKKAINNNKDNHTKFIIIARDLIVRENCNKISVVFSLEDEAGTLYRLLKYFAENSINMIKIESRPNKHTSWKYLLYVDFEGNLYNEEVQNAIKLIKKNSGYFKLLGNYKSFSEI